jgi:hypothetical protein
LDKFQLSFALQFTLMRRRADDVNLRTMGCRARRRDHRAAHYLEGATLVILHALQEAFG